MQNLQSLRENSPIDLSNYSDEDIEGALQVHPSLWALTLKNEVGIPLEFKQHRFMAALYNDMSPLQVWLKPPQIGASTAQILKALWMAKKLNKQVVYTLPTDDAMYEMVSATFNRLIAQNSSLQKWVEDTDTMSHKAVGNSMIRFRGTQSATQAMMYPSDVSIHDEVDSSNAEHIQLMETRQQAKAEAWRWY